MSQKDWQTDRPLVIDTNTALSALIGGVTRTLILKLNRGLYFPGPSFDEIKRNRGVIQERANLPASDIDELIETIFKNITFVAEVDIVRNYDKAANTTSPLTDANQDRTFFERDENDVVFLATALAVSGDIWSDDGVFKHQDNVTWYRTEDVIENTDVDL